MIVIGSKEKFGKPTRYFSVSQPPHGCHDDADISPTLPVTCLVFVRIKHGDDAR